MEIRDMIEVLQAYERGEQIEVHNPNIDFNPFEMRKNK